MQSHARGEEGEGGGGPLFPPSASDQRWDQGPVHRPEAMGSLWPFGPSSECSEGAATVGQRGFQGAGAAEEEVYPSLRLQSRRLVRSVLSLQRAKKRRQGHHRLAVPRMSC